MMENMNKSSVQINIGLVCPVFMPPVPVPIMMRDQEVILFALNGL